MRLSTALTLAIAVGCGSKPSSQPDAAGADASLDATTDSSADAAPDVAADAPHGTLTAEPPDPTNPPCAGVLGFPDLPAIDAPGTTGFAVADFDGDGRVDILYTVGTVFGVGLGRGDGTFSPPQLTTMTGHLFIQVGDVDGDGDLDLVTPATSAIAVSLNLGGGHFAAVQTIPMTLTPDRIALGDLDGNGRQDIVAMHYATNAVVPVLSTAAGFVPQPALHMVSQGEFVSGLAVGDLTGDGRAEVLLSTNYPGHPGAVNVQSFTATGVAATRTRTELPWPGEAMALGDFDEDGKPDIAIATYNITAPQIGVLLNQGGGVLGPPALYPVGGPNATMTGFIAVADVNGDGHLDVGRSGGDSDVEILRGTGTGQLGQRLPISFEGMFDAIAFADLDGDARPEAIVGSRWMIAAQANTGTIGAFALPRVVDFTATTVIRRVALLDLDDDHVLDLVGIGNGLAIARHGYGIGTFADPAAAVAITGEDSVISADLDNDGRSDLLVAGSGSVQALMNHGHGTLTPVLETSFASKLVEIGVGDFDADGFRDVIIGHDSGQGSAAVELMHGHGDGKLDHGVVVWSGAHLAELAVADFDRDGKLDLVIDDRYNPSTRHFLAGHGDGTFAAPVSTFTTAIGVRLAARDLDGDGNPDLIAKTTDSVVVSRGLGNGTFGAATASLGTAQLSPDPLTFADVDGDGHLDAIDHVRPTDITAGAAVVFLGAGTGSFTPELFDAHTLANVAVGDLDGDGRLDMIGGTSWQPEPPGAVTVLHGRCR